MIEGHNSVKNVFPGEDIIQAPTPRREDQSMMDYVLQDLKERRDTVLNGGINCIPWPFERFRSEIPGIESEQYVVITANEKVGKCFAKGTHIRMSDNTVKCVEDIRIGDYVMSPGKEAPKQVTSLGSGREEMFCISSEMHNDIIVNESHIMYLYNTHTKKYMTMTVKELLREQSRLTRQVFKDYYRMVMSDECEFNFSSSLPLEPYFYGVWLGDGDTDYTAITTPDKPIIDYLYDYAQRLNMKVSVYDYDRSCKRYCINGLNSHNHTGFKTLVRDVTGFQKKHINPNYLNASVEDRYQFLAGIIDTDGYLNYSKSGYRITLQHLSCIEEIAQLANSLGIATTIRKKYNKQYDKYYYELRLNGKNCVKIPTRVKKCKEAHKDFKHYPFSIKSVGEGEYYGLTVEGNHLFLLDDYTIVHNSQFTNYVYVYHALDYAFEHPTQCTVHIIYFALEESIPRIINRYMSYLLWKFDGERIPPTDLRSTSADYPLPDDILEKLESPKYQERLKFFEEHVQFETEDTNPTGILRVCEEYAKKVGKYKTKKIQSRGNVDREVEVFESYEVNDKKHFKIAIIDHGGLIDLERGMSLKQSMDKMSEYCVKYLRNRYKFTIAWIQQQAMESEGLEAIKQKRMTPSVASLGDTKYTARDANLVLSLYDPSRFGLPTWLGYKINDVDGIGLQGSSRFMKVERGRDGEQGGVCPLYFDGAVCNFEELPQPDDINAVTQYYNRVKSNRSYRQQRKLQNLTSTILLLIRKVFHNDR